MRALRLLLLLIVGFATMPACAAPCQPMAVHEHHAAHHRAPTRPQMADHAVACLGCAAVLPEPWTPAAPPMPIAMAFAAAPAARPEGFAPALLSPPPRG